jgi:voltage-gated potassium channel Kch
MKFETMMNTRFLRCGAVTVTAVLTTFLGLPLMADTIELADGSILEGDFIGSSNGIIMFNTGDGIEAYPEDQVTGVFFSSGVQTATAQAAAPPAPSQTVPAGTRLVIRTIEDVDTKRHGAGHRFRAQLEGALVVGGVTVVPKGAFIHGVISSASQSGRVAGSSNLTMEFTDIMIDDVLFPISTTDIKSQTAGEAGRTLRRTARAAAIGGLIDGKSGARTGMKVGAGASILTSGASINVPRGTILETTLRTPLLIQ